MSLITREEDSALINGASVISFLLSAIRSGERLSDEEDRQCHLIAHSLRTGQDRLELILKIPREGELEVGLSEDEREVLVNLPQDMTGHLHFTRDEALNLARLLTEKANQTK